MSQNSKRVRERQQLGRQKAAKRCRIEEFCIDLPNGKYQKYRAVYDTNLSLINIVPSVSQKMMSAYRGTCPAILPVLIREIQDEVFGL